MTLIGRNRQNAAPAVAAALLALAFYAVTLGGTYIYDDLPMIVNDPRVHSPDQWKLLWTKQYFPNSIDNLYRPLTSQTFALQWWLHGDKPWAFHLVNLLLHAAAAALVAELARRLAGIRAAYIAGLLFAAHPVHVEVVAEIVGRGDELCAVFMLAALVIFLHRPITQGRAIAIGLCGIGAMLSKEQGMLVPLLLMALAACTQFKTENPRQRHALMTMVLILSWSLAGLIVLREEVLGLRFEWDKNFLDMSIQPLARGGALDHALMVFVLIGRYAQLMIAPVKLSIDYGLSVMGPVADRGDPYLYVGIATVIAMTGLSVWSLVRRQGPVVFCLIGALLTYSMVSNVFLIATIFGERMMYIPSIFLLIMAAIYLARLPRIALTVLMTVLIALSGVRTISYALRWNDRYQFYVTSLREQPRSVRLHETLGMMMLDRGDLKGAAEVADDGIRVAPDYWNIWYLRGKVAEEQGDRVRALEFYKHALKLQPVVALQNRIKAIEEQMSQ